MSDRREGAETGPGILETTIVLGGDLNDLWGSLGPRYLAPAGFLRAGALMRPRTVGPRRAR